MTLDRLYTDLWRIALVAAPIEHALNPSKFGAAPITWLPLRDPNAYAADPFGFQYQGRLTVFAEHYDYRQRHGVIAAYDFDDAMQLTEIREVLREPWHLSYPVVLEEDGEIYMLPEGGGSGRLTLYRAVRYPWRWERAKVIIDAPLVDATPFRFDGMWWIAATPYGGRQSVTHLLLYHAESLMGPWRPHALNPVLRDRGLARPGGQAFQVGASLYLPGQDCRSTYGGALVFNRIDALSPDRFLSTPTGRLEAPMFGSPYEHGLHTIARAGPNHSVIDLKRRRFTPVVGVRRTVLGR